MSKVTITLEDSDDGLVIQTVSYGEKFEVASNAHQFAGMMLKLAADEVAKQNSREGVVLRTYGKHIEADSEKELVGIITGTEPSAQNSPGSIIVP